MTQTLKNSAQMTRKMNSVITLLAALLLGCATTGLTRQDVMRQYDTIAALSDGLEDCRARDGVLLAPSLFEKTEWKLDQAIELAGKADKQGAIAMAEQGLDELAKLNEIIQKNSVVMEEVIDIRARAYFLGAAVLFTSAFNDADEGFRTASHLLEQGKTVEGQKRRSLLIEQYAKLELDALKKGTVAAAKEAISAAEKADADDYAPKTLQSAREELKLALSVLDADRTQVDKGNAHAAKAKWMASRAHVITNLNKFFESQNYSEEDVMLWYQAQLQRVRGVLQDETLPFDQSNARVIQVLRADAIALKSVMMDVQHTNQVTRERTNQLEKELVTQREKNENELQQILTIHEQQLVALNSGNKEQSEQARKESQRQVEELRQRLSKQALAEAESERKKIRAKERFAQTQHLFNNQEAEVFRQGDNVLIRLKGFSFNPGKFTVESANYALLNKVVAAINTFPMSDVTITGHTDAKGSDAKNIELSAARAQSVVEFLSTVGGVALNRLSADGKGEEQPLASNETSDGRAMNRRIDLLIVNTDSFDSAL